VAPREVAQITRTWCLNLTCIPFAVCTGTYQYVRVHTRAVPFFALKKCKQVSNPRPSAYFSQNMPQNYGGTDLDAENLLCCHQCIHSLPLPSVPTISHAGHRFRKIKLKPFSFELRQPSFQPKQAPDSMSAIRERVSSAAGVCILSQAIVYTDTWFIL
jgi:hypothetical protein